jgi:uncharacterized protein
MSSPQITTIHLAPSSPNPAHYRTPSGSSLVQNGGMYPEQNHQQYEYPPQNHYESPLPSPQMMPQGGSSRSNSPLNSHGFNSPGLSSPTLQPPQRPLSGGRRLVRPASSRSSMSSLDYHANNIHFAGGPPPSVHEYNSHSRRPSSTLSLNETASQYASASMFDLNQSYLTPHFGANASSSLMPRIKTIELYRQNAKKSNDPLIQFQFAQYMLQTALLSGTSNNSNTPISMRPHSTTSSGSSSSTPSDANLSLFVPDQNSFSQPRASFDSKTMSKGKKGQLSPADQEKKIKADLLKEAISHLRKLSDKGFADAQYLLGDAYASGALGKPDFKESFTLFQLAAKHGHAEAAYRAALCLEEGWGTSKDIRRAIQFLRSAATKNQPGAMFRLGMACFHGRMGFANNSKIKQEGIKWLTRAAESANEIYPQGPYELAKIYEEGYKDIVFKDLQYTVQLYVRSADLHFAPAAAKLGAAYEYGSLGCPQDAPLSIHYYTIAAMAGDPNSMLAMCAWYMVGADPVLPRNEEEAYEWALRAAQRGLGKAQYAVGYFLENGIGCERDILESTKWYRQAAERGDERAAERLQKNRDVINGRAKMKKPNKDNKDCVIC